MQKTENVEKYVFLCEDSLDGILSAVHDAYTSRLGHANIELHAHPAVHGALERPRLQDGSDASSVYGTPDNLASGELYETELFTSYKLLRPNPDYAHSVRSALWKKGGRVAAELVYTAALSNAPDKADVIYHFLVRVLANGPSVLGYHADPYIGRMQKIYRRTTFEAEHWKEFLRFRSGSSENVLLAKITPEASVLSLIMPHFCDRFPEENILILDETHHICAVHPAGKSSYFLLSDPEQYDPAFGQYFERLSQEEDTLQDLWKVFCETIAIPQRRNPKLQRSLFPLKFRQDPFLQPDSLTNASR